MAAVEDVCLLCAEPLQWVAVMPCSHKEVCGKCILRLRLIMNDMKCMTCQNEANEVLVTRHNGMFTSKQPQSSMQHLKDTYFPLKADKCIYVDDEHYRDELSTQCTFSCAICYREKQEKGGEDPQEDSQESVGKSANRKGKRKNQSGKVEFNSLPQLKKHLKDVHSKFMCDVCLEGRKVFPSEQVLYSRSDLARHYKRGDTEGPMKEAGFKGHPSCHFCKKHFYSDQELYSHMQTKHMQCFICKRARPGEYVYYKNLADLSNHFATNHHFCTHEACKDRHPEERVFATKEEFHVHYVQTHGESLSKTQKKQALQINVQYQSYRQENTGRNNRQQPQVEVREPPSGSQASGLLSQEAFPDIQGNVDVFAGMDASQQQWRRAAGGNHGNYHSATDYPALPGSEHGNFSLADYPALPGMSKSAKKRAKAKARAAQAVARNRTEEQAAWGESSSSGGSGARQRDQTPSQTSEQDKAKNRMLMQKLRNELDSIVFNAFRQESASFLQGRMSPEQYYKHVKSLGLVHYASDLANLCPNAELKSSLVALIDGDKQKTVKPRIDQRDESQKFVNLASLLRESRPSSSSSSRSRNTESGPNLQASDFPSMSGSNEPAPSSSQGAQQPAARTQQERLAQNYTDQEKQANKMLMMRLKTELDEDTFAAFRVESVNFLKGSNSAENFYHLVISLGLAEYVDGLANLCPDLSKRKALRDLHKASLLAQMQFNSSSSNNANSNSNSNASNSFAGDEPQGSRKAGKKKKKQGKFERVRLGLHNLDEALQSNTNNNTGGRRANPHNSWSQGTGNSLFPSSQARNDFWS